MSDWPGDVAPLPHAATEDRLRARLAGMVAHCSTPDCPGDYRYPPPGRGHIPGCTYPFAAPDEESDR